MTRLFINSPISFLGYLYATAVGFCWAFLLSEGRIKKSHGLYIFTGLPKWSFGRGGTCIGACYLTDTNVTVRVLVHERVHKEQWKKYGLLFPIFYYVAGRNPLVNRFEIEAGLTDGGYLIPQRHQGKQQVDMLGEQKSAREEPHRSWS